MATPAAGIAEVEGFLGNGRGGTNAFSMRSCANMIPFITKNNLIITIPSPIYEGQLMSEPGFL
jgi:hypothetical protein